MHVFQTAEVPPMTGRIIRPTIGCTRKRSPALMKRVSENRRTKVILLIQRDSDPQQPIGLVDLELPPELRFCPVILLLSGLELLLNSQQVRIVDRNGSVVQVRQRLELGRGIIDPRGR